MNDEQKTDPCADQRAALAAAEAALSKAEADLSKDLGREGTAIGNYDRSNEDKDLQALQRAKLKRERSQRLRDQAAECVGDARKALADAELRRDRARIEELRPTLTDRAIAQEAMVLIMRGVEIDQLLAKLVDDFRALIAAAKARHREMRECARRCGDQEPTMLEPHLDDVRLLTALVVGDAREREGRGGSPIDVFLAHEERPEWNTPDRERYDRAVQILRGLGAIEGKEHAHAT